MLEKRRARKWSIGLAVCAAALLVAAVQVSASGWEPFPWDCEDSALQAWPRSGSAVSGRFSDMTDALGWLERQYGRAAPYQRFVRVRIHPALLHPAGETVASEAVRSSRLPLHDVVIEGFENIDGWSNEALWDSLLSRYTQVFLRNSVGGIRYLPWRWGNTAASARDVGYIRINVFLSPEVGAEGMTTERAL